MTQTPASGPFSLVTTPPISSSSIGTALPACRAASPAADIATKTAIQVPGNMVFFAIRSPWSDLRTSESEFVRILSFQRRQELEQIRDLLQRQAVEQRLGHGRHARLLPRHHVGRLQPHGLVDA